MKVGFFDIIFECNSCEECEDCKYANKECFKFTRCFDYKIPAILWREVTSFDEITEYVIKWREYDEQTDK